MGIKNLGNRVPVVNYGSLGSDEYRSRVKGGMKSKLGFNAVLSSLQERFNISDENVNTLLVESTVDSNNYKDTIVQEMLVPCLESLYNVDRKDLIDDSTKLITDLSLQEALSNLEAFDTVYDNSNGMVQNNVDEYLSENYQGNIAGGNAPRVSVASNGASRIPFLYGARGPFITRNFIANVMKSIIPPEVPDANVFTFSEKVPLVKLAGENDYREMVDTFEDQDRLLNSSIRRVYPDFLPMPITNFNLVDKTDGASLANGDMLNDDITIHKIKLSYTDSTDQVIEKEVVVNLRNKYIDNNSASITNFRLDDENGDVIVDKDGVKVAGIVSLNLNIREAKVTVLTDSKHVKAVAFNGTLTDSYNNYTSTVDWTVQTYEVSIPYRPHVTVALTPDKTQEMKFNFNINYQAECLNIMHELLNQQEDIYLLNFLRQDVQSGNNICGFNKNIEVSTIPLQSMNLHIQDAHSWAVQNIRMEFEKVAHYMQDVLKDSNVQFVMACNPILGQYFDEGTYDWKQSRNGNSGIDMDHNIWFSNKKRNVKLVTSNKFSIDEGVHIIVLPLSNSKMTYKTFVKDYYMTDQLRTHEKAHIPHITVTKKYEAICQTPVHTVMNLIGVEGIGNERYKIVKDYEKELLK